VIPHIDSVTIIENAEEETQGRILFCFGVLDDSCLVPVVGVIGTVVVSCRWSWCLFGRPEAAVRIPKEEGVSTGCTIFLWQTIIDNDHDAPQGWTFGRVAARNDDDDDEDDPEWRNFCRRRADDDRPFLFFAGVVSRALSTAAAVAAPAQASVDVGGVLDGPEQGAARPHPVGQPPPGYRRPPSSSNKGIERFTLGKRPGHPQSRSRRWRNLYPAA
jgi:hypothetical protein